MQVNHKDQAVHGACPVDRNELAVLHNKGRRSRDSLLDPNLGLAGGGGGGLRRRNSEFGGEGGRKGEEEFYCIYVLSTYILFRHTLDQYHNFPSPLFQVPAKSYPALHCSHLSHSWVTPSMHL